jgi:riboflavin synthase
VFTGLIADVGRVRSCERDDRGARLVVETALAGELGEGDSIAVGGVCLTATAVNGESFAAEAMHETLTRSALGALREGSAVNLELALRAEDRLGGHIVQGHVDGTGTVTDVTEDGFSRVVSVAPEPALLRYLVEKGSVAVDGVSLTVSRLGERDFSVSLIPETLQRTTLGDLSPGAIVNLEVDVLAKHVERLLGARLAAPEAEIVS